MSNELDLTALREIASAATEGPWGWTGDDPLGGPQLMTVKRVKRGNRRRPAREEFSGEPVLDAWASQVGGIVVSKEDATHIAAFDPPTTLALINRLEDAEEAVARARDLHRSMPVYDDECGDMECEREHVEINADLYHADQIAYQACEACSDNAGDVFPEHVEYPCATRRALEGPDHE
ncbi:ead/Ea22-like family protein [Zhihengliuella halotolerans]|uniref:ead/Ea22-like family protein n=1 Tax=Zhihengliuella halotolerans TaxID=370736 RepID=UPI000C80B173|nr:ead/Ea22-like family protein [Zhihengliuella halotolerans]